MSGLKSRVHNLILYQSYILMYSIMLSFKVIIINKDDWKSKENIHVAWWDHNPTTITYLTLIKVEIITKKYHYIVFA